VLENTNLKMNATGAGNTQGAAGNTQGAAGNTQSAAGNTQGAAGNTQGAAGNTQGAAGNTQGAAGNTQGAAGNTQSAAGNTQGAAGNPPVVTQAAQGWRFDPINANYFVEDPTNVLTTPYGSSNSKQPLANNLANLLEHRRSTGSNGRSTYISSKVITSQTERFFVEHLKVMRPQDYNRLMAGVVNGQRPRFGNVTNSNALIQSLRDLP
jgi:hypothetical protein